MTIYHGDNFNTTELKSELMNNGNNQEGIGIYFGSLDTAISYGKDIVTAQIDKDRFINSRALISEVMSKDKIRQLLKKLGKTNPEEAFYLMTDYGIEICEPDEVEDCHYDMLSELMLDEEVRNFQITLSQTFDVKNFVNFWNELDLADGTFNDELEIFCIINTSIKVKKYIAKKEKKKKKLSNVRFNS